MLSRLADITRILMVRINPGEDILGRVHAHIDFSDERNGFGGHLEEGCLVFPTQHFCSVRPVRTILEPYLRTAD